MIENYFSAKYCSAIHCAHNYHLRHKIDSDIIANLFLRNSTDLKLVWSPS